MDQAPIVVEIDSDTHEALTAAMFTTSAVQQAGIDRFFKEDGTLDMGLIVFKQKA